MKQKHLCESQTGELVRQLPRGVTFAYYIIFGLSTNRSKGLPKEDNSGKVVCHSFGYGVPYT